MVYSSDFYTSRRPAYYKPSTSYSVTPLFSSDGYDLPPSYYKAHQVYQTCTTPSPIILTPLSGKPSPSLLPYSSYPYYHHQYVPLHRRSAATIHGVLDKIEHRPRSHPSYDPTDEYLNSRNATNFDDVTRDIRAQTAGLLKQVYTPSVRPKISSVSNGYSEVPLASRIESDAYIEKILSDSDSFRREHNIGKGHLACVSFAGGRAYPRRRPHLSKEVDDNITMLSYYNKTREAVAASSTHPTVKINNKEKYKINQKEPLQSDQYRKKSTENEFKADKEEKTRLAAEKEAQRLAKEEEARLEAQKESERLKKEEEARLEAQREAERLEKEEEARLAAEKEAQRLAKEEEARLEAQKEAERLKEEEEARLEAQKEAERLEKEEEARLAAEKEAQRLAKEEEAKLEAERLAKEEEEKAQFEAERLAKEEEERARLEAEKAELEAEKKALLIAEESEFKKKEEEFEKTQEVIDEISTEEDIEKSEQQLELAEKNTVDTDSEIQETNATAIAESSTTTTSTEIINEEDSEGTTTAIFQRTVKKTTTVTSTSIISNNGDDDIKSTVEINEVIEEDGDSGAGQDIAQIEGQASDEENVSECEESEEE